MASCCDPPGYDEVFDVAFARRLAKRYRRKGLDRTAGRMVEALTDRGVDGATVLRSAVASGPSRSSCSNAALLAPSMSSCHRPTRRTLPSCFAQPA